MIRGGLLGAAAAVVVVIAQALTVPFSDGAEFLFGMVCGMLGVNIGMYLGVERWG